MLNVSPVRSKRLNLNSKYLYNHFGSLVLSSAKLVLSSAANCSNIVESAISFSSWRLLFLAFVISSKAAVFGGSSRDFCLWSLSAEEAAFFAVEAIHCNKGGARSWRGASGAIAPHI